jgi:hypothetical protein
MYLHCEPRVAAIGYRYGHRRHRRHRGHDVQLLAREQQQSQRVLAVMASTGMTESLLGGGSDTGSEPRASGVGLIDFNAPQKVTVTVAGSRLGSGDESLPNFGPKLVPTAKGGESGEEESTKNRLGTFMGMRFHTLSLLMCRIIT